MEEGGGRVKEGGGGGHRQRGVTRVTGAKTAAQGTKRPLVDQGKGGGGGTEKLGKGRAAEGRGDRQ